MVPAVTHTLWDQRATRDHSWPWTPCGWAQPASSPEPLDRMRRRPTVLAQTPGSSAWLHLRGCSLLGARRWGLAGWNEVISLLALGDWHLAGRTSQMLRS